MRLRDSSVALKGKSVNGMSRFKGKGVNGMSRFSLPDVLELSKLNATCEFYDNHTLQPYITIN